MLQSKSSPHRAADLWSRVNNIIGRSKEHKSVVCDTLSLDSLNEYFQTVAVGSTHQGAECFMIPQDSLAPNPFTFDIVSVSLVRSHLLSLDITRSTGPDNLSARFLQAIADQIVTPLTDVFNCSLRSGEVPSEWKRSHITPIYKGGPPDDPSNFRPISVVPVLAKILEKIVSDQLSIYLEDNHLLHPHQGAYRSGKSTQDILLVAVDNIVHLLDKGEAVCAAFLDLRKAFDSLDHHILLQRLYDVNVSPPVLRWFRDYLIGRLHRVKRLGRYSDWRIMRGGIPQGSALGPLLFLIYMNSLPSQISQGLLLQYADDTALICSGHTPTEAGAVMNSQLMSIQQWIVASKMRLNYSKSTVVWFRVSYRKQPSEFPDIVVDDTTLQVVKKQKYLGVILDNYLSWSHHVSYICKKMSYYLYVVNKHRHVLSSTLMKLLIDSLVFSHVNYSLPVWGPSLHQTHFQRLKRMQNRAVRLCRNLKKFDHITEHYRALRWLPLEYLIQYRCLCLMNRQYHGYKCIALCPPLQFGRFHQYGTRVRPTSAHIERCRLSHTQKHFRYKASHWWNSLPQHITSVGTFSYSLFNYLCGLV